MNTVQPGGLMSLPTTIPPENGRDRHAFCQMVALAPPPHGAPCSYNSVKGFRVCIDSALSTVNAPNAEALEIQSALIALESELKATLLANGAEESLSAMDGTKTRHPEWHFLVRTGAKKQVHRLATLYMGLKSLMAIRAAKPLSKSTVAVAAQLLKEEALSGAQITALLHGTAPEQTLGQSWPRDLCRTWREVMRHFAVDGTPPSPTTKERIAGQILDAALHATASRRAGARTHRQLSKSQLHQALSHIGMGHDNDTILGALGTLVCITTFSVDVVPEFRLSSNSVDASWLAQIDIEAGLLKVDYGSITHQASAPIAGAIAASYICRRPLPTRLAQNLRARLMRYPDAQTLKELYPDELVPAHDSLAFACRDQIQPTWARLRRVVGTFLREAGMDNLLACIVSGDFTHVPRSKLYYACVSTDEVAAAFTCFYKLAGWSEPTPLPDATLAFGCQVVPTLESLKFLDRYWKDQVKNSQPGKHCSLENLLNFHNNYMCWTAMRLSLLLALRESTEINVCADVDERHDRWIPIHDKHVPGDHGAMPVPLTDWVRLTIQSIRTHCKAMQSRLQTLGSKNSNLARWCTAVRNHSTVPLLCIAASSTNIRPIGTADFINGEIRQLVPPDFGRKALENLLRACGLRASEIDAILRHSVQGQATNSVTSDAAPMQRWARTNQAVTQVAASIFEDIGYGLAKE